MVHQISRLSFCGCISRLFCVGRHCSVVNISERWLMDLGYWETEAGQFIAGSLRYLRAAGILRHSNDWGVELQSPTLHLVAHGIELLCKFPLISLGNTQDSIRRIYGHDLSTLWRLPENSTLRAATYREGGLAWTSAQKSGVWPLDNFEDDSDQVIDRAVDRLSHLHGRGSNYALRYTLEEDTFAPRPAFLIDAFGRVAERIVMNPRYLDFWAVG